jgi:hypothetical protein
MFLVWQFFVGNLLNVVLVLFPDICYYYYYYSLHHLNFHTLCNRRLHLEEFFLIDVYSGFTSCPFLLETVGVRVPTRNFRDFPLFTAAFSNKSGLSAKCGEPGSSVIIVSGYGLDDRAIEVRSQAEAKDFSSSLCVQTGSGAHQASCTVGTGCLFRAVKRGPGVTLTTHPHVAPRSRMSRSYISSPPKRHSWRAVGQL